MSSGTCCPHCGSALRNSTQCEEVFAPLEDVRQDIPRELSTIYSNKCRCSITGWTWLQRRGGRLQVALDAGAAFWDQEGYPYVAAKFRARAEDMRARQRKGGRGNG